MSPRTFLVHGLVAGLLAGCAAFLVAFTVGEPHVDAAIAVEESGQGHTHDEEAPLVSRETQSTWGLATGTLAAGLVLGGLTGLAAAVALGRLGALRPAASTAVVAATGFVAVALVPFLKYPATPPAVGSAETIGDRTAAYFGFLGLSVLAAFGAVLLARRLLDRWGGYAAVVAGGAAYLLVMVVATLAFPAFDEVGDFPAATLWSFRVSSLLTLATLWGAVGVVLTGLTARVWAAASQAEERRALAASL